MICTEDNTQLLRTFLEPYHVSLSDAQARLILKHLDLVVEKNRVMNLTRITGEREAIILHAVDSLLLATACPSHVEKRETARFVDVGTGAGFPGIPLAVCEGYSGVLIDSVGKKVRAVQEFIQSLGLQEQITAEQIRAEDLARKQRGSFDLVVARAVAELGVLVEYASPLLRKDGMLVVSKGQLSDEELEHGLKTAEISGLKPVSHETHELPEGYGHREILTYQKVSNGRIRLPRKAGMAKHKPLFEGYR